MILLVCWCGVRSEVEEVLEKVVGLFTDKTLPKERLTGRAMALANIGNTILDVLEETYDGTLNPLSQMMMDAEAGISKHAFLVAGKTHEVRSLAQRPC